MFKVAVALLLAVAFCAAEPPRYRGAAVRQQFRRGGATFARQEAALPVAPAPTGYPVAGITPETPFDLPPQPTTAQPDNTYLPPDNTYGPPEAAEPAPEVAYGPPLATEVIQEPQNAYGPPAVEAETPAEEDAAEEPEVKQQAEGESEDVEVEEEEEILVTVDEDGSVISVSTAFDANAAQPLPARLVYQRFPQSRRQRAPVPARLTAAKPNVVYVHRNQRW